MIGNSLKEKASLSQVTPQDQSLDEKEMDPCPVTKILVYDKPYFPYRNAFFPAKKQLPNTTAKHKACHSFYTDNLVDSVLKGLKIWHVAR